MLNMYIYILNFFDVSEEEYRTEGRLANRSEIPSPTSDNLLVPDTKQGSHPLVHKDVAEAVYYPQEPERIKSQCESTELPNLYILQLPLGTQAI